MTDELAERRAIYELGVRAIVYYKDTGLCVFCGADDCLGLPHEDHCNVGELSKVTVDKERIAEKAFQRGVFDAMVRGGLKEQR